MFATSEFFVPTVRRYGFSAVSVGAREPLDASTVLGGVPEDVRDSAESSEVYVLADRTASAAVPDLYRVVEDWQPTIVVRDSADFASCLVAEMRGIPYVTMSTSLATSLYSRRHIFCATINRLRIELGLDEDAACESLFRFLHLEFMPRPFFKDEEIAPSTQYFEQTNLLGPNEEVPSSLVNLDERSTVFVNFGTLARQPQLLLHVYRALRSKPINLLIKTGSHDARLFDRLRGQSSVHFVPDMSPTAMLPSCDLFITHGGFNGVKEALRVGVPMIIIPLFGDQRFIATRCAELGLCYVLDNGNVARGLGAMVDAALVDERLRARVSWMQGEMRGLPDVDAGAGVVEALA